MDRRESSPVGVGSAVNDSDVGGSALADNGSAVSLGCASTDGSAVNYPEQSRWAPHFGSDQDKAWSGRSVFSAREEVTGLRLMTGKQYDAWREDE